MTTRFQKGHPMPKSIGLCADEYSAVRAVRLAMDKEVDAVKARESEIREHIINNLSASDDTGAAGKIYRAQIVKKSTIKVADWPAFHAWVSENNRFDMLQKRLAVKAVTDYVEEEKTLLPGTEKILVPEVSITKI